MRNIKKMDFNIKILNFLPPYYIGKNTSHMKSIGILLLHKKEFYKKQKYTVI